MSKEILLLAPRTHTMKFLSLLARAVVHPEVELEPGIPSSSRAGSCPYPATPG